MEKKICLRYYVKITGTFQDAQVLEIDRVTFYKKINKYNLRRSTLMNIILVPVNISNTALLSSVLEEL